MDCLVFAGNPESEASILISPFSPRPSPFRPFAPSSLVSTLLFTPITTYQNQEHRNKLRQPDPHMLQSFRHLGFDGFHRNL